MLILLLLLPFLVAGEWVEISQNHYRKEPSRKVKPLYEEPKNINIIYNNQTLLEHVKNKGLIDKISNIGNIERVRGYSGPSVKIENYPFHDISISSEVSESGYRLDEQQAIKSTVTNQRKIFQDYNDYDEQINNNEQLFKVKSNQVPHHGSPENQLINLNEKNNVELNKNTTQNFFNEERFDWDNTNLRAENTNIKKQTNYDVSNTPIQVEEDKNNNADTIAKFNTHTMKHFVNYADKVDKTPEYEEKNVNKTKNTAMETIIKLLKVASEAISRGTHKNYKSKVRYLQSLKDTLLTSIQEHIEWAFPDDDSEQRRSRREAWTEPRGHVQFPSSESALMTISFLTFAVFLIKLVLQVIHTYKAKTMMVTPAVVATVGRATAALKKFGHN